MARDIPVVRPLILVAGLDIVAADHARQRDSPARAEPVAVAPHDDAVVAGIAGCRPSVSSAPSLQPKTRSTLGAPLGTTLLHPQLYAVSQSTFRVAVGASGPVLDLGWVSLGEHPPGQFR